MNPTIDESLISNIRNEFCIQEEPSIQYDHSEHYKCHDEDGWEAEVE